MLFNVWVTTKCNMNCKYCYEKQQKNQKSMSFEIAEKVITFICEFVEKKNILESIVVNFHGGEPLICFDIIKYLTTNIRQKLKNRKLYFGVTTNGLLLNDEIIDFLINNFMYSLSISIDGNQQVHDYNRILPNGQGTHGFIINNAKKLLEKRQDVRARMTFTSSTVKYLYNSVNYLYTMGFKTIVPVADYFDPDWDLETMDIFREELNKIYLKYPYRKCVKENLKIGLVRDNKIRLKNGICDPKKCSININYDGLLYPCTYVVNDKNYEIGNLESGIDEYKLNPIVELSKSYNKDCLGCNNYNYCTSTRCKLVNKVLTDDYNKASPVFCNIENIIYELSNSFVRIYS